jgi:hypothetical protein
MTDREILLDYIEKRTGEPLDACGVILLDHLLKSEQSKAERLRVAVRSYLDAAYDLYEERTFEKEDATLEDMLRDAP